MHIYVKQCGKIHEVKLIKDNGDTVTVKGISGNMVDVDKKDILKTK